MNNRDTKYTLYVFDLDDTLYKEQEYQISGIKTVRKWVKDIYGIEVDLDVESLVRSRHPDILGLMISASGIPAAVKSSLLWVYRLHLPHIELSSTASTVLNELSAENQLAILTDGRSISQRLKIAALGLSEIPAFISEEYDSEKPNHSRFIHIMSCFEARNFVYIADNPQKDFMAPNQLGWETIGLIGDARNVHSQDTDGLSTAYLPTRWIHSLSDLL